MIKKIRVFFLFLIILIPTIAIAKDHYFGFHLGTSPSLLKSWKDVDVNNIWKYGDLTQDYMFGFCYQNSLTNKLNLEFNFNFTMAKSYNDDVWYSDTVNADIKNEMYNDVFSYQLGSSIEYIFSESRTEKYQPFISFGVFIMHTLINVDKKITNLKFNYVGLDTSEKFKRNGGGFNIGSGLYYVPSPKIKYKVFCGFQYKDMNLFFKEETDLIPVNGLILTIALYL